MRTSPAAWAVAAVEAAWPVSVSLAVVAVSLAWIFANEGNLSNGAEGAGGGDGSFLRALPGPLTPKLDIVPTN